MKEIKSNISIFHRISPFLGIIIWILFSSLLALFIRIVPLLTGIWSPDALSREPDVLYHIRQIEYLVSHPFQYPWFDPMTNYPGGSHIQWGPVFSQLGASIALIAGVGSRESLTATVSWLPVLLAVLLVPVVYLLGSHIWDRRAGCISAFIIAILPGMVFHRSVYGYIDHHIAEVLFTAIFCLCYLIGLSYIQKQDQIYRIIASGFLAGIALAVSIAIIPTVITFSLVIGLTIIGLSLLFHYHQDHDSYQRFLILNTVSLLIGLSVFLLIGLHDSGISLKTYSIAHLWIYGFLIAVSLLLFVLMKIWKGYSIRRYTLLLFSIGILFLIILLLVPLFRNFLLYHLNSLFMVSEVQGTISELSPWGFGQSFLTYLSGWVIFVYGAGLCGIRLLRQRDPLCMFLLFWGGIMFISTLQHWRFEYYLSVPVALLIGIGVSEAASRIPLFNSGKQKNEVETGKKGEKKEEKNRRKRTDESYSSGSLISWIIILCFILFSGWSFYSVLLYHPETIPSDQIEAMNWLKENTPYPGLNLTTKSSKDSYQYPDESYGVFAWWDYGHMISLLGERIAYSNPFQENAYLASRMLTWNDEDSIYRYFNLTNGRYIITDTALISENYPSVLAWRPGVIQNDTSYIYQVMSPNGRTKTLSTLLAPGYYQSLTPRLHVYDGSLMIPDEVIKIRYHETESPVQSRKGFEFLGEAEDIRIVSYDSLTDEEKKLSGPSEGIVIAQSDFSKPVVKVPALCHFRLVYESNNQTWSAILRPDGTPERVFSSIKIFEIVPGAKVSGEGIVELTLRTNTGREFVYRQESLNGTFLLPYPTDTCAGDVCPVGNYLTLSGLRFEVNESDIWDKN